MAEATGGGSSTSRSLGGEERERKRLKLKNFFLPSFSLSVLLLEVWRVRGTIGADVCGSIEGAKDDGVRRMSPAGDGALRGGA